MGIQDGEQSSEGAQINLFTGDIEAFEKGKDELNLAEFPIAVVAESARPGQLTLVFSDAIRDRSTGEMVDRSVTVHGTEEWGLPAAQDDDVMIGLLQICFLMGWPKRFQFSRYQLCKLLRWSIGGASYRRIYKALHRLSTTSYNYRYAWRDRTNQEWIPSQVFSYIQALKIHQADKPTDTGFCEVIWSDNFFQSLEAGNLKGIDFNLFVSLKRSIAKRLYRFIDKRFGAGRTRVICDLKTLAFEKVGISRTYKDAGQIKRLLMPAIKELEDVRYLAAVPPEERFQKFSRGVWKVHFERFNRPEKTGVAATQETEIERKLLDLGIVPSEAKRFVAEHPQEYLESKIVQFPFRQADRNPAGLLAASIREDLPPPAGYQDPKERQKMAAQDAKKRERMYEVKERASQRQRAAEAAEEQARKNAEQQFSDLSDQEKSLIESEARRRLPNASPQILHLTMIRILMDQSVPIG